MSINISFFLRTLVTLLLFFVDVQCKCSTGFLTTCEKPTDIARYGKATWTNLIIANDQCSTNVFGPPDEVLRFRAFNKVLNLEQLYIVEKLVSIQPGAFDGLDQLTYLKLYKNLIKVIPRGAFSNLTQLFKLDLKDNSIENIEHGLFANSSITSIDLSNNKLTNIQVDMLVLPSLKKLIITNNDISLLVPNCFHENLEYLNLDHNNLVDLDEGVLQPLKKLKELILSNNKLNGIAISFPLENLEKLDLSHNQIQGIKDGSFSEFFELKYLFLGHNRISYLSPKVFPEGSNIQVLHLHQNAFINIDERIGAKLPLLHEMSIGGNPWACPCLEKIIEYFGRKNIRQPECELEFFANGESPVCSVTSGACTGKEVLTEEIYDEFKQALSLIHI